MGTELVNQESRTKARRVRPTGISDKIGPYSGLLVGVAVLGYYLLRSWHRGTFGFLELTALAVLSTVCLLPLARWFQTGMPHLPLGEGFAFMHLIYYVIPCLGIQAKLEDFAPELRLKALLALILHLGFFVAVYWLITERVRRPLPANHLLRREANIGLVWVMFVSWVVLEVLLAFGKIIDFGAARNIFNGLLGALGSIAVVCLFYRCGRGIYGSLQLLLVVGLAIGVGATMVDGVLCIGAGILGAAALAYSLGRRKVSIVGSVAVVVVLGFLQIGKSDYRTVIQGDSTAYVETPSSFQAAYSLWFRVSWRALTESKNDGSHSEDSIWARTSLIQILVLSMDTVPHKSPYLYGKTYAMIPKLLIPRIFWAEKMRGTYPTEFLGTYLGIQTEGGADYTGISVGAPSEAWLNFGWLGMALVGAFSGLLFGLPAALTRRLEPQNLGWLICCYFLVTCIDMEHSIPEKVTMVLQAVFVSFFLLLAISTKPRPKLKAKPSTGLSTSATVGESST